MSRLRQKFYLAPLVLSRGHLRPVVDLFDVAWSWLADAGERRLVQVYARPDQHEKLARDGRVDAVEGEAFDLLQELTHREGGPDRLREALARTPGLADAARDALAALPEKPTGEFDAHRPARRGAGPSRPRG